MKEVPERTDYNPENDFARPLTKKQHEAYLEDIAASYGMTAEEVDDYYASLERDDADDNSSAEDFEHAVPESVRELDNMRANIAVPPRFDDPGHSDSREALLAETYRLEREIGFVGFRQEYRNELASLESSVLDEIGMELRTFWDSMSDFESYRESHADTDFGTLTRYRDHLTALQKGPKEAQAAFYRHVSGLGRAERGGIAENDNGPGGDGKPPDGQPKSDFDRQLHDTSEQEKYAHSRAGAAEKPRLPSPGEIARDTTPYVAEQSNSRGRKRD